MEEASTDMVEGTLRAADLGVRLFQAITEEQAELAADGALGGSAAAADTAASLMAQLPPDPAEILSVPTFFHGVTVGVAIVVLAAMLLIKPAPPPVAPSRKSHHRHHHKSSGEASTAASNIPTAASASNGASSSSSSTAPATASSDAEVAVLQALREPKTVEMFHSPRVHAALEEMRSDPTTVAKYKDDSEVMQAISRLLEIEGLFEKL